MATKHYVLSALISLFAALSPQLRAQVVIPVGGSVALNGGALDLGGTALQVGGAFSLGSGSAANITDIGILAGGTLDGGSGTLTLSGNFSDAGTFTAGTGHVNFIDGALAQSAISGSTTFANLSIASVDGKSYALQVGTTQTVQGQLQILGTSSAGVQIRSSAAGQVAFIDLLPSGTQDIAFVGVSNVHATGLHLAPNQTNDGGTGDASGWFGTNGTPPTPAAPIPTLSTWSTLLLGLLLVGFTAHRRRPAIKRHG